MFRPEGFSDQIFKSRYAFTEEETWEDACRRVARQAALAESPDKQKFYEEKFNEVLVGNEFVPGGRIWYNSGRHNPQLLNCFVLGNQLDSKEGWGNISKEMIVTSMTGGGCGIDFSDVRPRGAPITGQKGECPGPVALMELIDYNAKPVRAGGQRRVALMFSLDLDHPDVMEFLDAKLEKGRLTHANVSVRSKRTSEFLRAVKKDGDFELQWKGKFKKTIRARDLWDKIVKNAHACAEPGFLNWEAALAESNIYYIEDLVTTNPCVSGDTLILTRDGHKPIVSLVDTEVEVWNGFEWSKVTPKVTGHDQRMMTVSFSNGRTLRCTEYHTFKIATDYSGTIVDVKAKDLIPGMKLMKHELPIIEHGKTLDNAYLQGFYSAEGMEGYNFIYVYDTKQACLDNRLRGFGGSVLPQPEYGRSKFSFDCKLESKSFVPFDYNLKSKLDWLSGLFDGDGSELKEGGLQLWSVNRQFLSDLQMLLMTLGVNSKIAMGKPKQTKEMPGGSYECQECYRICIGAAAMQHLKKLGLSCVRITLDKEPNRDASQFVTVTEAVESGIEETVYCFNEPKRHLGVFNGVLTGQCGEIAMSSYDTCCLGHMVLPRFVKGSDIDWHMLGNTVRLGVRFLDNILTVNNYPLPEMKEKSHKIRRIGLGTTGLADMLALLGYKYGSPEGNKFVDKLFRFISKAAYEASVMLAIEKGPFPLCNPKKHVESGYCKRLPAKIKALIEEHGIRNCAILTQAPTGTVSILSGNCSSGIEPMFAPAYERRYFVGNKREKELVFHPLFAQFMDEGKSVEHFVGASNLTVAEHLEVQAIVQKHIDNAVSKTINMPYDYPVEDMSNVWLEYLPSLKGTTFYRENSRGYVNEKGEVEEPPLVAISLEEAKRRYSESHSVEPAFVDDCATGVCDIPLVKPTTTQTQPSAG